MCDNEWNRNYWKETHIGSVGKPLQIGPVAVPASTNYR